MSLVKEVVQQNKRIRQNGPRLSPQATRDIPVLKVRLQV